ncbi:unnamed protein product [Prorocentrum cordatum]|uniref:nicotinamidase n=2 Tax=Prorocentrum cordatum TaxID=2364126 RepID=A0ABN9QDV0_9DINO|nr:unnamed protein product [Polarella glacialis]
MRATQRHFAQSDGGAHKDSSLKEGATEEHLPMSSEGWGMHCRDSPKFTEYLRLARDSGWQDLVSEAALTVGAEDCLVVVDMQNDFIPADDVKNPRGGAFAVAEGEVIVPMVVRLMEHFAASGALVVATRDYHPRDHCSFISEGGHFPAHCVQGTEGSHFYPDIAACMADLKTVGRRAEVVFKGFHEDIDSFGSFKYPEQSHTWQRLNFNERPDRLYGCSLCSWTGCVSLKCSNHDNDINAPPDVLAAHARVDLAEMLKAQGTKRVFACGLAMDFCVLDTCLNALQCLPSVSEVSLLLDAARAAYLPGIGQVGSGFLTDLKEMAGKLRSSKVVVRPSSAVLPRSFSAELPSLLRHEMIGKVFPEHLGPFALIPASDLKLTLNWKTQTYAATQDSPAVDVGALRANNVEPSGSISGIHKLTLSPESLEAMGVPRNATHFAWAYSVELGTFVDQARAYFSITTPAAAFFVFGGFVYVDAAREVVAVMCLSLGSGLSFGAREGLGLGACAALRGRWQPVTAPFMMRKGARKYAWIGPKEVLAEAAWTAPPFGCFAYAAPPPREPYPG